MNLRAKLLLIWALAAMLLFVGTGVILAQMVVPQLWRGVIVSSAQDLAIGEPTLYDCNRTTGSCLPTQGTGARYYEFAQAARAGGTNDYALIWVVRDSSNEWHAFSSVSTHLGCFVSWQPETKHFVDPCSGAKWNLDGSYQEGPAPRSLDYFPVHLENGTVKINLALMRGKNHG